MRQTLQSGARNSLFNSTTTRQYSVQYSVQEGLELWMSNPWHSVLEVAEHD